ncbi:transmembrane protein, putative (macronuclear) [Tetrahymena thermophila SB210]|uniref:Transmembrane protein, putative n=1 Tax=Tetrahymena thermophila (strain SB210) TaxID=312017 RepID=W7XBB3_TETTS|nr:transmembrane protein, putative [Tetrahymena thermophila SB210]EWS70966.1 transmembrane protein, putative [Tetrahymena thermophila SB210]|eukprot:XP_012656522.1 transmembrane protein, putative [Tetrahymena thermophila SB210]
MGLQMLRQQRLSMYNLIRYIKLLTYILISFLQELIIFKNQQKCSKENKVRFTQISLLPQNNIKFILTIFQKLLQIYFQIKTNLLIIYKKEQIKLIQNLNKL